MIHKRFVVRSPSGDLRSLLIMYGLWEGMFFYGIFCTAHLLPSVVGAVCFFVLFLFTLIPMWLFRVEVDASTIRVRTKFGRKYELNCFDINKVVCTGIDSLKYNPQFYITVASKNNEFTIDRTMNHFDTMARYLLAQLENGQIKQTAVSKSCEDQLQKYQRGIYFK